MIWTILALTIGIPAVALMILFFRQDGFIYHPRTYGSWEPDPGSGVLPLAYATPDGSQTAYYLPPLDTTRAIPAGLWLLFGGNASLALDWLDFVLASRDSASGFLFVDYPGYGRCEGKPTPDGILRNSDSALAALGRDLGLEFESVGGTGTRTRRSLPGGGEDQAPADELSPGKLPSPQAGRAGLLRYPRSDIPVTEGLQEDDPAGPGQRGVGTTAPRLHVLGLSLGSAAALQFAVSRPVDCVVLLAPFTSMRAMAELLVGRWLSGLLRHRFDNVARLRELRKRKSPPRVYIIHGSDDSVVPVRMGRSLAASAPEIVTYIEVPGAGHNDLLALSAPEVRAAMSR